MLLSCPSTAHSRMPSGLLKTYVQYKQDTRAIIAWLLSHGPKRYQRLKTLAIQDLFDLANHVQKAAPEMPEIISFHFREAIAARAYLTKFFKQTDAAVKDDRIDYNHEYFTTSLLEMYNGLCRCCARSKEDCRRDRQVKDDASEPTNRFAVLHAADCTLHDVLEDRSEVPREPFDSNKCTLPRVPQLADDGLSAAFELRKEVDVRVKFRLTVSATVPHTSDTNMCDERGSTEC